MWLNIGRSVVRQWRGMASGRRSVTDRSVTSVAGKVGPRGVRLPPTPRVVIIHVWRIRRPQVRIRVRWHVRRRCTGCSGCSGHRRCDRHSAPAHNLPNSLLKRPKPRTRQERRGRKQSFDLTGQPGATGGGEAVQKRKHRKRPAGNCKPHPSVNVRVAHRKRTCRGRNTDEPTEDVKAVRVDGPLHRVNKSVNLGRRVGPEVRKQHKDVSRSGSVIGGKRRKKDALDAPRLCGKQRLADEAPQPVRNVKVAATDGGVPPSDEHVVR